MILRNYYTIVLVSNRVYHLGRYISGTGSDRNSTDDKCDSTKIVDTIYRNYSQIKIVNETDPPDIYVAQSDRDMLTCEWQHLKFYIRVYI